MQRVGFPLKVRLDRLDESRRLHNPIWPELAADLRAAGMRNYTLWLTPDGTEFGYLECDGWKAVCAKLAESAIHTKWQQLVQGFLETPMEAKDGCQPVQMLEQVFQLDP